MAGHATFSPVRLERLRWLEPPAGLRESFAGVRARLEACVSQAAGEPIYTAHRRCVYRAQIPALGAVAIKELRNPSPARQLWFGWLAEHPGVREYRVAVAFEARGGRTLANLGAALEYDAIGLARVLIFTRWLTDAVTLTQWLAERTGPPPAPLLASLASQIVAAARLGLVHQRHSSNNLLVIASHGEPTLHTIDFPHARLGAGLDLHGLACDVARIARWILHEKIWEPASVHAFFRAVAGEVRAETPPGEDLAECMQRELAAVIRDPRARRDRGA